MSTGPVIAIAMGDPVGIGPELIVKVLAEDEVQPGHPLRGACWQMLSPSLLAGVRRDPAARDIQWRQLKPSARHPPRRQRQIEGCDLGAARIDLQTEQIIRQYCPDRIAGRKSLFIHAEPHYKLKGLD